MAAVVRLAGTRPPDKVIRSGLCAGLDDAVADRVVTDFVGPCEMLVGAGRRPA